MIEVYHNPRCRKSREACALLDSKGVSYNIREYLKDSPDQSEVKGLLQKLNIPAEQLIRKTEAVFKEEYKGKSLTEDEWIEAMVKHPKLIERPIVIKGDQAVVGRPPENIQKLF